MFEIWRVEDPEIPDLPVRVQMRNYVACFASEERAQAYIYAIKAINGRKKI
jgi:hypothetical protein